MTTEETRSVKEVVDMAIRHMISAEHFHAGSIVSIPVLYPGGGSAAIEITAQRIGFRVSDRGVAALEAEMIGASRMFNREAERMHHECGIEFDGSDIFLSNVSADKISGAMTVVAHYSQQLLNTCYLRTNDKVRSDATEQLVERLIRLFTSARVAKNVDIIGQSNHEWQLSALVKGRGRNIAFDVVAPHPTSAVWTAAKFDDLSRLDHPPSRIAVVSKGLGNMIGVVSNNATAVIEAKASDEVFLGLEKAA